MKDSCGLERGEELMPFSREYATALYGLAAESEDEERICSELFFALDCLSSVPDSIELLSAPAIPKKERCLVLETAFGECLSECTVAALLLLCEKESLSALGEIADEYEAIYRSVKRESVAQVTSAVVLTPDQRMRIKARLEGICRHAVSVHYDVDSSLIGGAVVRMDEKTIDGSLAGKLSRIGGMIGK